jgi:hypothetical protein
MTISWKTTFFNIIKQVSQVLSADGETPLFFTILDVHV